MIIINYLRHFDPIILFFDNSNLRYHQLPFIGLFYPWQIIFIAIGFLSLLKRIKQRVVKLIFSWLLMSPSAAALTSGAPYANISRALMMLPIIELFCAYGVLSLANSLKKISPYFLKHVYYITLTIILSTNLMFFIHQYYKNVAKDYSEFWGKQLKETVLSILPLEDKVDKIIITNELSPQTYMYILFYGKKDPYWFFNQKRQEAEIVGYRSFGKYEIRQINWYQDKNLRNILLIGTSAEIPENANNLIKEIKSVEGDTLIKIVKM